jgi:hypothetical protein
MAGWNRRQRGGRAGITHPREGAVRAALEAEIRIRVQQAAPQLVGDLWGRERVTVAFERLRLEGGIWCGTVVCELYSDELDVIPVDTLIGLCLHPVSIDTPNAAALLELYEIKESLVDGYAICQLLFKCTLYLHDDDGGPLLTRVTFEET